MSDQQGRGILIVEDEKELLTLFAFLLEFEHFTVFQAGDGQRAVEVLESHLKEIDLIITDLGLPNVGGVDLISRARTLKPSIKIIGTSGLGGENIRTMVLDAGADRFIPKPFHVNDVIETIKSILAWPSSADEGLH